MALDPEIEFHRFFHSGTLSACERRKYTGKLDLDKVPAGARSLLTPIQIAFNKALKDQTGEFPDGHARTFHFDFVEALVPNALAFEYQDYAFIGITGPLVATLWRISESLSKSEIVTALLGVSDSEDQREATHIALFTNQLTFVVAHEYSHHYWGHSRKPNSLTEFWNEIAVVGLHGSLDHQAREADADGLGVYYVLDQLIKGERRSALLKLLALETASEVNANEVLLASVILAIGAYFRVNPPEQFDEVTLYKLTHPPYAARMNLLTQKMRTWCEQQRPALASWLTLERFQEVMRGVEDATDNPLNWSEQNVFFASADGTEYFRRLHEKRQSQMESQRTPTLSEPS